MFEQARIKPETKNSKLIAGATILSMFILGMFGPVIVFFISKDRFVKFHAAQMITLILFCISVLIIGLIISIAGLYVVGEVFAYLLYALTPVFLICLGIASLVPFFLYLYLAYSAFTGKAPKLPLRIGSTAESWALR